VAGLERRRRHAAGVRIKDLADRLGVSTGTVDRALNDKPEINAETRERVLALARKLGYTPNLAARYLGSRRPFRIAVLLPRRVPLFWDALRDGVREASAPLGAAVDLEFRLHPSLGVGDVPLLARAIEDDVDGLILAPGDPEALAPGLDEAARRGIPVVAVVTDLPAHQRLVSVSADLAVAGAMAGELLGRFSRGSGRVACFSSPQPRQDHMDRLRGLASSLRAMGGLELGPIVEANDDERGMHRRVRDVLRAHDDVTAIYIGTGDALPVLRAVEREGRVDDLAIVATDLSPELADWIAGGKVAAAVCQRPREQGRTAFQALWQHLQDRNRTPASRRILPSVVMRSNVRGVVEQLAARSDAAPPGWISAARA
jgi:LacI family transcriptional regulator